LMPVALPAFEFIMFLSSELSFISYDRERCAAILSPSAHEDD
jgi:hypothetical protein